MAKRKSNDIATGAEVVVNGGAGKIKARNSKACQNGNGAIHDAKRDLERQQNGHTAVHDAKRPRLQERTDYTRWRMRDDESRHTWHYLEDDTAAKEWPQTFADKYYLGLPLVIHLSFNGYTLE